jgi:hypothetical protein
MTDPTSQPASELGLLARAIGVITSPAATFAHVVRDPRPTAIVLVVSLVIAVAATIPQLTERGRQAALKTQVDTIEWATGKAIPDDAYAQLEANSRNSVAPYFSGVGAFVFMPIVTLFFAALFWGLFNALLGGTATFKQVLGVVAQSTVIMALGAAISVPIQLMQTTFSLAGPFNLGALVPMLDPDSFVKKLLSATSAITIWQTIVVAIGLGVLYKRKSTGIAIGLLVAYGALVAIGVSLFSALMSRMGS